MLSRNVSSLSLVQKGEMMQSNDAIRIQPTVLVVDHEAEVPQSHGVSSKALDIL
jgi:hypothetical protein